MLALLFQAGRVLGPEGCRAFNVPLLSITGGVDLAVRTSWIWFWALNFWGQHTCHGVEADSKGMLSGLR